MSIARAAAITIALSLAAPARAALMQYGEATIAAGEVGQIGVWLRTDGEEIVATQNDIQFSSGIHALEASDHPFGCHVNPDLHKDLAYRLLSGSSDSGGERLRAIVISFSNLVGPIPDGTLLYTCDVQVLPTTQPGTYPLRAYELGGSDATGRAIPIRGINGAIHVLARPGLAKPLRGKHTEPQSFARFLEKMVARGRGARQSPMELGSRLAPRAADAKSARDAQCPQVATPTATPIRRR